MKKVVVKRDKLQKIVQKNRDEHRDKFLKAQEGYREMVIEELDQMLSDARTGKPLRVSINMPAPQDHTDDYDTILNMLEYSVDENLELEYQEFRQYVENDWHWYTAADITNTMYATKSWK